MATSKRRNALGRREIEPLDARAARVAALDALARRDYASEDLRRKLLEKGYDAAVVAPLLDALRAEKLLDDRRYMENFVAYHAARGQGPLRVRADLRRHGLQGTLVEECLDAYPDWIAQLRQGAAKEIWRADCRATTLTGSARRDSWVTEVSRALRYEWP